MVGYHAFSNSNLHINGLLDELSVLCSPSTWLNFIKYVPRSAHSSSSQSSNLDIPLPHPGAPRQEKED
jgi:hypothetical protein